MQKTEDKKGNKVGDHRRVSTASAHGTTLERGEWGIY